MKRNLARFPGDFAFQLSESEVRNRSQVATGSQKHRGIKIRPWVFTEHGALMAANVLRSERAVQMSVYVIRAFVRLREGLAANAANIYQKLLPLLQPPPVLPKRRIGF